MPAHRNRAMNLNLVLYTPEIPHNTGAIGRLCVCLDARLHLIQPLGFSLRDTHLQRSGLDYWQHVQVTLHRSWDHFLETEAPKRLSFISTKGRQSYSDHAFAPGEYVVFGSETSGLPPEFYDRYRDTLLTIPMPGRHARSLNLATAVAIVAYEAYRQLSR